MWRFTSRHNQRSTEQGARGSLAWSLGGGLLAILCCVGPLAAVLLGVGGAASTLGLVRFKYEFIAVGLIITLIGIGISLRRTKACCSVQTYRRNRILIPTVSLMTFAIIVVGLNAALLNDEILSAASERLTDETELSQSTVTATSEQKNTASVQTEAPANEKTPALVQFKAPDTRQLDVAITAGVYCPACLLAIQDDVMQTPGVQQFTFVKDASSPGYFVVRVVYEPGQTDTASLLTTIRNAPGSLGGEYVTELVDDIPSS
jgi:hypothetical protein